MSDDQATKPITHNSYFGGQVQSLRFTNQAGLGATVGVILPGEYDFGEAVHEEHIVVISGTVTINGNPFEESEICVISAGGSIRIEVNGHAASYLCTYH